MLPKKKVCNYILILFKYTFCFIFLLQTDIKEYKPKEFKKSLLILKPYTIILTFHLFYSITRKHQKFIRFLDNIV